MKGKKWKQIYYLSLVLLSALFSYTLLTKHASAIKPTQESIQTYYVDSTNNPSTSISSGSSISINANALNFRVPITYKNGYNRLTLTFNYFVSKDINNLTSNYVQYCGTPIVWDYNLVILEDQSKTPTNNINNGVSSIMCNRRIIFDVSNWNNNEIRLLSIWNNGQFTGSNFSFITGNVTYRAISYVILNWWNTDESTTNAIEQQNETYQTESTDYSNTETTTNSGINQGQNDIEQGGQSLIAVITGFKTNVLDQINTSSTDCELNLGNPYGFNMGAIDLCYYRPPTWLTSLLNICASLAIVGLALHVFWRIINVIKGFSK